MHLRDILKAQRSSGKPPSLSGRRWSALERERAADGRCLACGERPPSSTSYLCPACEADTSIEDIRTELSRIRERILGE